MPRVKKDAVASKEQDSGLNKENNQDSNETADKRSLKTEALAKETLVETAQKPTAKSGKRSAKAIAEKEAIKEKEARKSDSENSDKPAPKATQKPARSHLERQSKKMRAATNLIDKSKNYTLKEASELVAKTSTTKFDATVELHIKLNVDPKQADQNVRDSLVLPAGSGKTVRVAVFAEPDIATSAKKAGADISGEDEITSKLDKGIIEFDVLITSPSQMPKLSKFARTLGPKGLMPNPKSGTVTNDIAKAVKDAKAGRVEYRVDSAGIVHLGVGKVSFASSDLQKNLEAVLASITSNKPASIKGLFVQSAYLSTTMGPSIRIETK